MDFLEMTLFFMQLILAFGAAIVGVILTLLILGTIIGAIIFVLAITWIILSEFFREKSSDELRINEIHKKLSKIEDGRKYNELDSNDQSRILELYTELSKIRDRISKADN